MIYPAQTIANYLIWCANSNEEDGEIISNLKLQKLLYYAQGLYLARFGTILFIENIEAWQHGPVVRDVYFVYNGKGAGALTAPADFDPAVIEVETRASIDGVYSIYGQYSAWKLRDMTHQEAPWRDTKRDEVISVTAIHSFFAEQSRPKRDDADQGEGGAPMISEYIHAAMRHAEYRFLAEDGVWYAEIPQLEGVWAIAATRAEIASELREALEGWIALGLRLDHPFPVIDGVGLVVEAAV